MPNHAEDQADQEPRLLVAYPQVLVADVTRAADFYERKLGFSTVYLYGEPPFYGLVTRDGAGLNLRHVDPPIMQQFQSLKEKEIVLAANIPVNGVKELFLQLQDRGVVFAQSLKAQPWGATDFIVRDIDGNLICFASAVDAWSREGRLQGT
jgi:catechol 2,3-dioxygenase-like lactoylglutathione lyase family enzyme